MSNAVFNATRKLRWARAYLISVLVEVPAKHLFGYRAATRVMGPIHGLAFVFYAYTLVETISAGGWKKGEIARLALAAFMSFGALASDRLLRGKDAALASARI